MEKLSKFVISRLALRQQPLTEHPDADVLATFAEGGLFTQERESVLGHLGQCSACRDVVALLSSEVGSPAPVEPPKMQHGRLWWRWAATAAVACLIAAVVWRPEFIRVNPDLSSLPAPATTEPPVAAPSPLSVTEAKPQPQKTAARVKTPPMPESKLPDRTTRATTLSPSLPSAGLLLRPQGQSFANNVTPRLRSLNAGSLSVTTGNNGSLWRLPSPAEENGMLQKSDDGGKTWGSVRLNNQSRFYALSASGPDVWAGGAQGALFHSSDNGSHWTAVAVTHEETPLTGTITRIDVLSENAIKLKVQGSDGFWTTTDGGAHWYRE